MFAQADPIARAEAYPFDVPDGSLVFRGTEPPARAGRTPVLCIGSNAAPSRLAAKLADDPTPVPLDEAVLWDHAVVYSAHVARYGSIPATLTAAPGACTRVFVAWFTDHQLRRVDASEGVPERYRRAHLRVRLELAGGERLDGVWAYVSGRGPLTIGGTPVRLAEVPTLACPWPQLTQRAMLRLLHRHLAPHTDYRAFVRALAENDAFRADVTARLTALGGA